MNKLKSLLNKELFKVKNKTVKVWHLTIVLFLLGAISNGIKANKIEGEYKSSYIVGSQYVYTYIKLYDDGSMGIRVKNNVIQGQENQEGSGSWEKLDENKIVLKTSNSRFGSIVGEYQFSPGSLSNSENTFKKN